MLFSAIFVAVGATPANAVDQGPGTRIYTHQVFYSYVRAGESLDIQFTQTKASTQPVSISVQDPTGAVIIDCAVPGSTSNGVKCGGTNLTSATEGIWKIVFDPDDDQSRYLFDIAVRAADSSEITGRTWTDVFNQYQNSAQTQDYWLATREGYVYGVELINLQGQGSAFRSNGFGLVNAGTCTPIYRSVNGTSIGANGVFLNPAYAYSDTCGDPFWVFFEKPDANLPPSAPSADGTLWVRPAVVAASATNLEFTADGALPRAGDITFDLAGVNGGYTVQIDTNADGDYTDPADRIIPWGSPPGAVTVPFDGLDGLGSPIGICQAMNARVVVDRAGEIHFVLEDVEQLGDLAKVAGGVRLTGETPGVIAPNPLLYWDDTDLAPNAANEPLPSADGTAGVDTSTIPAGNGAHGWRHSWGDRRSIENWSYYQTSAGAEVAISPPCDPAITIDKQATLDDANSNGVADVDEKIAYTFLVSNTGNADLSNVTVDDPRVTATAPASAEIPVGMTQLFTATYTVRQSDVDDGGVSNSATATGEDPNGEKIESPPDNTFVPGPDRDPKLSIDKSSTLNDEVLDDDLAELGETVAYSFTVTNTGNVTLENVTVADDLVVGIAPAPVTLAPGEKQVFTASPYAVQQADLNTGTITNTASATATSPTGDVQSPPDSTTTPTLVPDPLLQLDKSGVLLIDADSDGTITVGDTVRYTFGVTNIGTVDLEDVAVIDPHVPGTISPPLADIPANSAQSYTTDYTVQQTDIDTGVLRNTAYAEGSYSGPDGDVTVASAPDRVELPTETQAPALALDKSSVLNDLDGDGLADIGETITYSFLVTNTGNTTLTNIAVLDTRVTFSGAAPPALAPGDSTTVMSDPYTVTQADVDAGGAANVAVARGNVPGGPDTTSPPDNEFVPAADPDPGLTLTKSAALDDASGNGIADEGEQIVYSFQIVNTGNVTLFDVTVVDDDIPGLVPDALDQLAPGIHAMVVAGSYTVTAEDVAAHEIVNVASATSVLLDGSTIVNSNEDDVALPTWTPVQASGPLARTGAEITPAITTALLVLLLGVGLMLGGYLTRRHPRTVR